MFMCFVVQLRHCRCRPTAALKFCFVHYSVQDGEYCPQPVLAELTPPGPPPTQTYFETPVDAGQRNCCDGLMPCQSSASSVCTAMQCRSLHFTSVLEFRGTYRTHTRTPELTPTRTPELTPELQNDFIVGGRDRKIKPAGKSTPQ